MALTILLVEDHEDSAAMLARLLRDWGHRVTAVGTVAQAKALALGLAFDMLLCDIGLPDGSGNDLLRALLPGHPIRAVALTGYSDPAHVAAAREAGFSHYLTKPILLPKLRSLLLDVEALMRSPDRAAPGAGEPPPSEFPDGTTPG